MGMLTPKLSIGEHFAIPIVIKSMDSNSRVHVAVTLADRDYGDFPGRKRDVPISGFPIIFKDLETVVATQY